MSQEDFEIDSKLKECENLTTPHLNKVCEIDIFHIKIIKVHRLKYKLLLNHKLYLCCTESVNNSNFFI